MTLIPLYRALAHTSRRRTPSFYVSYSTGKPSPSAALHDNISSRPRPREIPFQPKVANTVNFIGVVQSPVKFLASPDGKYWAATVISQTHPWPISLPVVFEGDLAHTVACHLKENDNIYIAGHLSNDKLPSTLIGSQDHLQVMVNSFNFVQGSCYAKGQFKSDMIYKNPSNANDIARGGKAVDPSFWVDLVNNPTKWRDFRTDKINEVVNPKHPDFKHIEDRTALWLNSAPSWIVAKLEGLEFNRQAGAAKKLPGGEGDYEGSADESWKNLIDNPNRWWDNRSTKATPRHPDFKNKDTGESLWLNRAPQWAINQLPPLAQNN